MFWRHNQRDWHGHCRPFPHVLTTTASRWHRKAQDEQGGLVSQQKKLVAGINDPVLVCDVARQDGSSRPKAAGVGAVRCRLTWPRGQGGLNRRRIALGTGASGELPHLCVISPTPEVQLIRRDRRCARAGGASGWMRSRGKAGTADARHRRHGPGTRRRSRRPGSS